MSGRIRRWTLPRRRRRSSSDIADSGPGSPFVPRAIEVAARHLTIDGGWVACFAITGYPREVQSGWLAPLLAYPGRLDVSLHIEPVDPATASDRLRRQLARLESGRQHNADHGQLPDPHLEAATEDAHELSHRVARGEARLYRVGLYLAVHAADEQTLTHETAAVRALAASLLLDATPTSYRQLAAWPTCLPLGLDLLAQRRTMDTDATAAAFPFTSPDLPAADPVSPTPTGVLYGHNLGSASLLHWDRWAQPNYNSVILGRSGAGKSYLIKLETLRSLYQGVQGWIIDAENEYTALAETAGATTIPLGHPGVRVNPFDLPIHTQPDGHRTAPHNALRRRTLFLHTVIQVLFGDLTPAQRAVLDTAITTTYHRAGITDHPATWHHPAPTLRDLADTLHTTNEPTAVELAAQLHPYTHGAFSDTLAGPTTTQPTGHLVVFNLREIADELKPLATLLTLDTIWRHVTNPTDPRPRLVVIDEAWQLVAQPAGARYLYRLAKSARKHWCGLTVSTQDTADLLSSDLGRAVVTNSATQILLGQEPAAINAVSTVFGLIAGERAYLLRASEGAALLISSHVRATFRATASPSEHKIATTDPHELHQLQLDQPRALGTQHPYLGPAGGPAPGWIDLDAA